MNRLLIRLWGVLDGEEPGSINYQIARTLVSKISSIKHTSSSALAELCNVSKPSISRFCKNLGYDDFYEFRAELNQYCPDRGAKYQLDRMNHTSDLIGDYLASVQNHLAMLHTPEIQNQIIALADDIKQYRQVYLLGNMQSGKTASSLHYNLHVLKKDIIALTSLKEQVEILKSCQRGTLIVIFSVSGEYFRALFPGGEIPLHPADSKIWMVTTNPALKYMDGVDSILNCRTGSDLAGSNICLEMTANLIALSYWNRHQA